MLRNKLKRTTEKDEKGYFDKICDEVIEFQRTRLDNLM